ncbi:M28 family peptidase [candidate division KSB1 bacterium]|nr:M28 family peptidase [candidate division KSB1 bacterium]RQW10713.1 MAG: M28 family peptidase [candidate division KSB1 bacterium]
MSFLRAQCDFGPRNPGSPGHRQCREYLVAQLKKHAEFVTTQQFIFSYDSPPKSETGYNIIGRFQVAKKNRVLLCAHWDTRPWADEDPDPAHHRTPVPGANDGASGVAVLLHMAELVAATPPTVGVDIVFFDAEDAGTHQENRTWALGSAAFAREFAYAFSPRYAILIDMIGDAQLNIYQDGYSVQYSRALVNKLWDKATELGINEFIPEVGYIVYDDHVPLLQAGIQSVDIIDFDYKYWHTLADTPDKCSAASLEKVGRVVTAVIYEE